MNSKAFYELVTDEALYAAADAWIRCLRGPGGDKICRETSFILSNGKFCEVLAELLPEDPLAFALFVENFDAAELNLETSLLTKIFVQGISASEYSLPLLARGCLKVTEKDSDSAGAEA